MLNMNLGFFNPETFGSRSESDVLDIVKYALKNLPMYNQLKGTEKGMILALRMFSFVCKLIPLWVRMSPQVEEYPNFYEEDRLYSFTGYFLTSRFNMEFDATNCDFKEFNDNLDSLIKFIKSIKPITKILNLIKYTIISDVPTDMLVNDVEDKDENELDYMLVYNQDDIDDMTKHSKIDLSTMHAKRVWFGYRPHGVSSIGGASVPNMFTALASLFEKYRGNFQFTYDATPKTINYSFIDAVTKETVTGTLSSSFDIDEDTDELFLQLTGLSTSNYGSKDINYARVNTQKAQFKKELKQVIALLKQTGTFVKRFSLAPVKVVLLDTGLYLSFTDGNTATYVSDIFRYIAAGNSAKEFIEKWATRSLGTPDVEIDGSDTLTIAFSHIPGTEVYNFSE
jgi:hypothetical protein